MKASIHLASENNDELWQWKQDCLRMVPSYFNRNMRESLCGDGTAGDDPAECVMRISESQAGWSAVELCREGSSIQGECFEQTFKLNIDVKQICSKTSSNGTASCINAISLPPKFHSTSLYQALCAGNKLNLSGQIRCANTLIDNLSRIPPDQDSQISHDSFVQLCQNTTSDGPVTCFLAALSLGLQHSNALKLCKGAHDDIPVDCFQQSTILNLDTDNRVFLCSNARTTKVVDCWQNLHPKATFTLELLYTLNLCRSLPLSHTEGPLRCIAALPQHLIAPLASTLCIESRGESTVRCFTSTSNLLRNETLQAELCRGDIDVEEVIECIRDAPYSLSNEAKVSLCRRITNRNQTMCVKQLWNGNIKNNCHTINPQSKSCDMTEDVLLSLCLAINGKSSLDNARCFLQATKFLQIHEALELCINESPVEYSTDKFQNKIDFWDRKAIRNDTNKVISQTEDDLPSVYCAARGIDIGLESTLTVELCKGSVGDSPIHCAVKAPYSGTTRYSNALSLCQYSHDNGPVQCANMAIDYNLSLTHEERSKLCRNSSNENFMYPPECVSIASILDIHSKKLVRLCSDISNITPAYCAKSFGKLDNSINEYCRNVKSVPFSINIGLEEKFHPKKVYRPGSNFTIDFHVIDQFRMHLSSNNISLIHASIQKRSSSSNGLSIVKLLSQDIIRCQDGRGTIEMLAIQPGISELHLCILNKESYEEVSIFVYENDCLRSSKEVIQIRITPDEYKP